MKEVWQPAGNQNIEWIDIAEPKIAELMAVAKQYNLQANTVADCMEPGHLPKFEQNGDFSFIIVRRHAPTDDCADTIQELTNKIAIFFNQYVLITIHRQPQVFLYELKHKYLAQESACESTQILVLKIVESVILSFNEPGLKMAGGIDQYEASVFLNKQVPNLQEKLYYLKRQAGISKKLFNLTEEVVQQLELYFGKSPDLEQLWDSFTKIETMYDRILEDGHNLTNVWLAMSAQRTNEVMRVLTIFSVFFMPLTFIAGIYGMNFDWMPELRVWWGYPAVWGLMLLITAGIYGVFKSRKWL